MKEISVKSPEIISLPEILPFGYVRDMRVHLNPPGRLCIFKHLGDIHLDDGKLRKGFILYDTLGNKDAIFPILQVWNVLEGEFLSEEEVFLKAESLGMVPIRVEGTWNY
jgi:hypothetical protein